jgi:mRNA interferase MazF
VLVLTRDPVIAHLTTVVVAPATTRVRAIPTEVALDEGDGMPRPCVLSLDNVTTVRRAHLTRPITLLSPDRLDEVCRALRIAIDC